MFFGDLVEGAEGVDLVADKDDAWLGIGMGAELQDRRGHRVVVGDVKRHFVSRLSAEKRLGNAMTVRLYMGGEPVDQVGVPLDPENLPDPDFMVGRRLFAKVRTRMDDPIHGNPVPSGQVAKWDQHSVSLAMPAKDTDILDRLRPDAF